MCNNYMSRAIYNSIPERAERRPHYPATRPPSQPHDTDDALQKCFFSCYSLPNRCHTSPSELYVYSCVRTRALLSVNRLHFRASGWRTNVINNSCCRLRQIAMRKFTWTCVYCTIWWICCQILKLY